MSDADRAAAVVRYRDESGCGISDATLAARAEFPFDDGAAPGDGFQKDVSGRTSHFLTDTRGKRGTELGLVARRTIEEYLQLARDHREMHYVDLFESLLDGSSPATAQPDAGE